MANFLLATDGKTYLNVDYIERVVVSDGTACIYTTEHRNDSFARVYKVAVADWNKYYAATIKFAALKSPAR